MRPHLAAASPEPVIILAVAAAAAVGSVGRYLVDAVVQQRSRSHLPLGTLVVNVTGSLALGLVVGFGLYRGLGETWVSVVGIGLLGGYTTFSTFGYETVRLLESGSHRHALLNIASSVGLGLSAAGTGLALAAVL